MRIDQLFIYLTIFLGGSLLVVIGCSNQKFTSDNPTIDQPSTSARTEQGRKTSDDEDSAKYSKSDENPNINHSEDLKANGAQKDDVSKNQTAANSAPSPNTQNPQPNLTATNSNVVTFVIPKGTGRGAWNTPGNPIRVKVGQTLQVVNEDSTRHQFHTNGSPFGHPFTAIAPGQKATFQIRSRFSGELHDHLNYGKIYLTTE
jgi:hypothetical protein